MVKRDLRASFFTLSARLLPGDRIHDVAPINKQSAPTAVRLSNIDAANAKRARKMQKRATALINLSRRVFIPKS